MFRGQALFGPSPSTACPAPAASTPTGKPNAPGVRVGYTILLIVCELLHTPRTERAPKSHRGMDQTSRDVRLNSANQRTKGGLHYGISFAASEQRPKIASMPCF